MAIKNMAASVLARLKNQSKEENFLKPIYQSILQGEKFNKQWISERSPWI